MLGVLIIPPLIIFGLLQIPAIQTKVVHQLTNYLEAKLQTRIEVGSVSYRFFNKLAINDLYIEDQHADTLLCIGQIKVGIIDINFTDNQYFISSISIKNLQAEFYKDSSGIFNYSFILKALKSDSSTAAPLLAEINQITLEDSRIRYSKFGSMPKPVGMNYTLLDFSDIQLQAEDLVIWNDSISGAIRSLAVNESCGASIKDLETDFLVLPQSLTLTETRLQTAYSSIDFEKMAFHYNSFKAFVDFQNLVSMDGQISSSSINFKDITYFAPSLLGMDAEIRISGGFKGTVPYLNTSKLDIHYGDFTEFAGDVQFIGLQDVDNVFIHAEISKFTAHIEDIKHFRLPNYARSDYPPIPEILEEMGYLRYEGYFTGLLSDFVAYGTLNSYVGELSTDIKFKEDIEKHEVLYSGEITARDFDIGEIIKDEKWLGRVALHMKVDGSQTGDKIRTSLDGFIQEIEINKYPLQNIHVSGLYEDEQFDGMLKIEDKNLAMDFTGLVNFRNEVPMFSFSAVVDTANLLAFGLSLPDSVSSFKLDMLTNFKGDKLDNFEGEIFIWDLAYARNNHQFLVEDIAVKAERGSEKASFVLQSSAADLELAGNYRFADLPELLLSFVNNYIPSLHLTEKRNTFNQDFTFDIHLKKSEAIFQTLIPGIMISDGSKASGVLNTADSSLQCQIEIPGLQIYSNKVSQLKSQLSSNPQSLKMDLQANQFFLTESFQLQNLHVTSESENDSSRLDISWNNNSNRSRTEEYSGRISSTLTIPADSGSIANILLHASEIVIADSVWALRPSTINYHQKGIRIDHFEFRHANQFIELEGTYALNQSPDTLYARFNQIDLAFLNPFTREWDFTTNGFLRGDASIISGYEHPLFFADLHVQDFGMNEKIFGNANFNTEWNDQIKSVQVDGQIQRQNLTPLTLNGFYSPAHGSLDFTLALDKFNLALLEPFADSLVTDVAGIASSKLKLVGTLAEPDILGQIKIQKASFKVDYLQTTYYFSDIITLKSDTIQISSLSLTDQLSNKAIVDGIVSHKHYTDFILDIELKTDNLQFLNTDVINNTDYYGKAFASAEVTIAGPLDKIVMDINATTKEGTAFFIPLYTETSLASSSFITFVKPPSPLDTLDQPSQNEDATESWILLNFNLEVTPDAEVQLIFDDKVGDIIKGSGRSNLKMEINTAGDFKMFGDFEILNGEYLFTLANFFSRKFKIKEGGIIRWTGNPYEATTNLTAYYNVEAPLKDLLSDTINDVYQKKLNIECLIGMNGEILAPDIKFSIKLPDEAENQQTLLDNLPENELTKQLLSLLIINQFQPLLASGGLFSSVGTGSSSIYQSASELLSNQLSHWVSQISTNFDIGLMYRPGDQITSDEYELALKTKLFNDYLIINGNFGYGGQYATTNTMVGDVEAEVKITKNGKVKVKAFNKSNTNIDPEKGPFTRGIGIFFREEFDSVEELYNRYFVKPKDTLMNERR
ncbi:MAG: translocation/assembly module TamB [Bacteroidales bacterium]|nr:translocation/assembly module TamB [Bacteroidales bacterium]